MMPGACGPWSGVDSAIDIFMTATTLFVPSDGPLCPSRICYVFPFSGVLSVIPERLSLLSVSGLEQVVNILDNLPFLIFCPRPLVLAKTIDVRMPLSLPGSHFLSSTLVARTLLILEQLVQGVLVYVPKVISLRFHIFLFSKRAIEVGFPNAVG